MALSMADEGEYLSPPSTAPTITKSLNLDTRYLCFIDADWNGSLIVYAQTASDPPLPQTLQQDLLSHGYAIAVARYQHNVNNGHDKAYHIQNIQDFFARRCGKPCHVYEVEGGFEDLPILTSG